MKRIIIFPTIEEAKAFILTQPRDPVFVAGVGAAEIAAATIRAVKAKKPQLAVLAGIAGAYDRSLPRGEVVEVVTERIAGIPERYAREYETTGPDLGLPLAASITVNRSGDGLRKRDNTPDPTSDALPQIESTEEANDRTRLPEARNTEGTNDQSALQEIKNTEDANDRTRLPEAGNTEGADYQTLLPEAQITEGADDRTRLPETGNTEGADDQPALPEIENMEGAAFFAVCEALGVACCQIRAVSNYVGEPFEEWAVEEAVQNLTEKLTQLFGNDE